MPTYFFLSSTSTLTTSVRTATKTALPMFNHIPYSILGLNETTDKFFTCKIVLTCSPMPQSFEQWISSGSDVTASLPCCHLRTLALLCLLVIATDHLSDDLLSYDNNNSLQDIFPHTCWCLRIRHLVNDVRLTEHPVQLVPTTPLTVWALVAVFLISFAKERSIRQSRKE